MGFSGILCGGFCSLQSAVCISQYSEQVALNMCALWFFSAFILCLFGHGNTLIKKLSHKTWQRRRKMTKKYTHTHGGPWPPKCQNSKPFFGMLRATRRVIIQIINSILRPSAPKWLTNGLVVVRSLSPCLSLSLVVAPQPVEMRKCRQRKDENAMEGAYRVGGTVTGIEAQQGGSCRQRLR